MNKLVILGAGGHARSLLAALHSCGLSVDACVALTRPQGEWPASVRYLGDDEALKALDLSATLLVNGIGSTRSTRLRQATFECRRQDGFAFQTVVDNKAIVDGSVRLDEGAQVLAGAVVQCGSVIGANAIVNTGSIVDHDCRIGAHAHLATGSCLSGEVTIGEGAHIGTGATVIQGIKIGAGALVAAGAVVIRDVPQGVMVVGIPATLKPEERSR